MLSIYTCKNSKMAFRAFQEGEAEIDSMVSTAVGSTAKGIIWEAMQARAMLQSLGSRSKCVKDICHISMYKMYLARSGSNSELSLRANISKKWKSWGFTEYQFLQKNHNTFSAGSRVT